MIIALDSITPFFGEDCIKKDYDLIVTDQPLVGYKEYVIVTAAIHKATIWKKVAGKPQFHPYKHFQLYEDDDFEPALRHAQKHRIPHVFTSDGVIMLTSDKMTDVVLLEHEK